MLRSAAALMYYKLYPGLRKVGLDLRLKRNSANGVVGVRALWGHDEPNITRGMVVEHRLHDQDLRFFIGDENDLMQRPHLMGAFYAEDELALLAEHYNGGTFVDIGANVGNHSLFALAVMNAPKVVAFEPNPPAFKILKYNMLLNGLAERIEMHEVGLSDKGGQAFIARSVERNLGGTRLECGSGPLRLAKGDDALAGERVGFVKIDVEALEMRVLEGLRDTIAANKPKMYVEVDRQNKEAFAAFVATVGYRIAETVRSAQDVNHLIVPAH